jgi:hypothetical protein
VCDECHDQLPTRLRELPTKELPTTGKANIMMILNRYIDPSVPNNSATMLGGDFPWPFRIARAGSYDDKHQDELKKFWQDRVDYWDDEFGLYQVLYYTIVQDYFTKRRFGLYQLLLVGRIRTIK